MVSVEFLKYRVNFVYEVYVKFFKFMLKDHEVDRKLVRLNGASWVLVGDTACIILFPKLIAITGMLVLSLADSFSAVFGKLSRGKEIVPDRTVPGTIAFFLVALIISFLTPKYFYTVKEYSLYIAMAVITTAVDFIKLPVDDNLGIPIVSSGILYISYLIFFPGFL